MTSTVSYDTIDFDDRYSQSSNPDYPFKIIKNNNAAYDDTIPEQVIGCSTETTDLTLKMKWPANIPGYKYVGPAFCSSDQNECGGCSYDKDLLYIRDNPKYTKTITGYNKFFDEDDNFKYVRALSDSGYKPLSEILSRNSVPDIKTVGKNMGAVRRDFLNNPKAESLVRTWHNDGASTDHAAYRPNDLYAGVVFYQGFDNSVGPDKYDILSADKIIRCCRKQDTDNCGSFDPDEDDGKSKCDLVMSDFCKYVESVDGKCLPNEDGTFFCTPRQKICACQFSDIDTPACYDKFCRQSEAYKSTTDIANSSPCPQICKQDVYINNAGKFNFDESSISQQCKDETKKAKVTNSPGAPTNPPSPFAGINMTYVYVGIGVCMCFILLIVFMFLIMRRGGSNDD